MFTDNGTYKMRIDTSNAFRPETNNTLSVGTSDYKWASMYATTFYGALSGSINSATLTSTGVDLANNDTLVFVDASDSSKIKQTSIKFDGSTATKALTQKGTFESFLQTSGGKMTGPLTWNDSTALPQFSGAPQYILGIESFANGGTTKWASASSVSVGSATNATNSTKVAAKLAATTKTYLLGTSTAITGTAANVDLLGDTGVYLTTTAGELSALKYSWHDTTATPVEKAHTEWNSTNQCIDFIFN